MSKIPAVSVIIPCLNRADTIMAAVRSVLEQTFDDLEVIVVDDGSTDGTLDMLQGIPDARLKLVKNPGPQGVSSARNYGVQLAIAPLIAFQDSDDLWRAGKLAAQVAKFSEADYAAVYCGMVVQAADGASSSSRVPAENISPLEGDILPSLTMGSFVSTQTLVVTRQVFDVVGGFDLSMRALVDWDLMLRIAQKGTVGFVPDELVEQRFSANSITHSSRKRLNAQQYILTKHKALLQQYPKALAHHYYRLAGGFSRAGDLQLAVYYAGEARSVTPTRLRYQLRYLQLKLQALRS